MFKLKLNLSKIQIIVGAICGGVLLVSLLFYFVIRSLNSLKITEFRYTTNQVFTTEQSLRSAIVASGNTDKSYFEFDSKRLIHFLELNSWVDYVLVTKEWPQRVAILVNEKQPYARWTNGIEKGYITKDGDLIFSPEQREENRKAFLDYLHSQGYYKPTLGKLMLEHEEKVGKTNAKRILQVKDAEKLTQDYQWLVKRRDLLLSHNVDSAYQFTNVEEYKKSKLSIGNFDRYANLPLFISSREDIKLAVSYWNQVRDIFEEQNVAIKQIRINSPDTWEILLANNITLYLDAIKIRESILRFMLANKEIVIPNDYLIGYVDLRYQNGLAIKFISKEDLAKNRSLLRSTLIPNRDSSGQSNPIFIPINILKSRF